MGDLHVLEQPGVAAIALSPLRRQILALLDEPASASELALRMNLTRQKLNYHLTVLARHDLIEVSEVRQRRGFEERLFRRTGPIVLAPDLVERIEADDLSAEAVVAAASDAIRSIGRLGTTGTSHPTATMTTDIRFKSPAAMRKYLEEIAALSARYDTADGVAIRVTLLSHLSEGEAQ